MCPYVTGIGINIRIIVRVSRAPPARFFDFETGDRNESSEKLFLTVVTVMRQPFWEVHLISSRGKLLGTFVSDLFLSATRPNFIAIALSWNTGGNTQIYCGLSQSFQESDGFVRQVGNDDFHILSIL
jgi:hypothetical protein